jgi:hypothetical protein
MNVRNAGYVIFLIFDIYVIIFDVDFDAVCFDYIKKDLHSF